MCGSIKEIGIFKIKKQSQIDGNRQCQHQPSVNSPIHRSHPLNQVEIDERGAQYHKNEFWSSPAVKKHAEQQNRDVFEFLRHQVVGDQKHRQEPQ